ncbi:hypothetical protein Adi01nite_46030 [Amorphoplanes digitatis]|nr:hypothetical protein Adi01nite_46030 [Actinoplanes digitatis]
MVEAVAGGHSGFGGSAAAGSRTASASGSSAPLGGAAASEVGAVWDGLSEFLRAGAVEAPFAWAFVGSGSATAGVADGPTASPCVVTGKACPIYASQTTGTPRP